MLRPRASRFCRSSPPLEFVAGEDGSVCAVKVQKMELGEPDESGRRRPVPIEGAIEEIPCDVAISAIGTNANPFAAKIGGKMELNKWGYIVADEETGQTTDPRIWAGGDIVTGARYGHSGDGRRQEGRRFHHQEPVGRVITCSTSHQTAKSPSSTRPAGTFLCRPPDHHDRGQAPLWWLRTRSTGLSRSVTG